MSSSLYAKDYPGTDASATWVECHASVKTGIPIFPRQLGRMLHP